MSNNNILIPPVQTDSMLLHSCCAPCSTAMVDLLLENDITPTIFYFNPNIYPAEEYEIRKVENKRYAEALGLLFIDGDYDHGQWKAETQEWRNEPERGRRCLYCFMIRLAVTAKTAHENGYPLFATTLATSRWKSLDQINEAGRYAAALYPGVTFWERNWRKNGLNERQAAITKKYGFYRQQYCGCEYSLRDTKK